MFRVNTWSCDTRPAQMRLRLYAFAFPFESASFTGTGGNSQPGAAVRDSTPVAVTRSVSSNCAEGLPSAVTAVHWDHDSASRQCDIRRNGGEETHVVRPVVVLLIARANHGLNREDLRIGGSVCGGTQRVRGPR